MPFFGWYNYNSVNHKHSCCISHKLAEHSKPGWLEATQIPPHQPTSQVIWQNRTIKSYIYLYLSKGKTQTYIWPLLSSQLSSTLFLLCPCSLFIPFYSGTRDLPPQKLRELNLPLPCVTRTSWINRQMGTAAGRKGCKKNSTSWYFCTETASQNSLKSAPSSCTTNLPPWGSQLHSDKQSRGSFCHTLPTSHLENTLKQKACGSCSCGQS